MLIIGAFGHLRLADVPFSMELSMKRIVCVACCALFAFFSISAEEASPLPVSDAAESPIHSAKDGADSDGGFQRREVTVPPAKRPRAADPEKLAAAEKRDAEGTEYEENIKTFGYGTPAEISKLIGDLIENEDPRFDETLYDLFQNAANNAVKESILGYFTRQKDPCLEDFAVALLDDPYDEPNTLTEKALLYVSEAECAAAAPALVNLLENGEERYFNGALTALGNTGGAEEAAYLAAYLERDDLQTAQRQALMRTLGAMAAAETFDAVVKIAQDEEENAFVRMYAAEAIGKMKNPDAVPAIIALLEKGDPNLRQYCIKGLANFPNSEDARNAVLQGIRDDHYKVRMEAIRAAKEMNIAEAAEYMIYRAKNDSERAVRSACYAALAEMRSAEGTAFLVEQVAAKKVSDSVKTEAAKALIKEDCGGESEIIELAKEALRDDRRKKLRAELGKLFIKYARPGYAEICELYLQSKDADTVSQGLELYRSGRYENARSFVAAIATDKKAKQYNRKRAATLAGIDEDAAPATEAAPAAVSE